MKTTSALPRSSRQIEQILFMKRVVLGIARHWLFIINLLIGVWVTLPWLAPLFMHWGWTSAGKAVYLIYSFQCHQLPERSFFLFGRQAMYSLTEIQSAWQPTTDPLILRQFIGNPEMGWKVAWSDRMVSMYTMLLIAGFGYGLVRKWWKPFSLGTSVLLLVPMTIDGLTHAFSDLAGIGRGFRDTNTWLQILTNNALPLAFYQGDSLGSFNSCMRLMTGVLFGIAIIGFAYPYMKDSFAEVVHRSEATLMKGSQQ